MATLKCIKCRRTIEPNEAMVVVIVDVPERWNESVRVIARLQAAPGRWHFRCAPQPVRQYAPATLPGQEELA